MSTSADPMLDDRHLITLRWLEGMQWAYSSHRVERLTVGPMIALNAVWYCREFVLGSVSLPLLSLFTFGAAPRPEGLGVKGGQLNLCPKTDNCVSTAEEMNSATHYIPPCKLPPQNQLSNASAVPDDQDMLNQGSDRHLCGSPAVPTCSLYDWLASLRVSCSGCELSACLCLSCAWQGGLSMKIPQWWTHELVSLQQVEYDLEHAVQVLSRYSYTYVD